MDTSTTIAMSSTNLTISHMGFHNLSNASQVFQSMDNTFLENSSNIFMTSGEVFESPVTNKYSLPVMVAICVILGSMILATIIGNIFVITAILVEKSLRGVSNYLILSLAVTDLLVAVLVMPLSLISDVNVHWVLGNTICDMWIFMDVLCCTASILHLVAIAFDRYWAVSNIDYSRNRSGKQIFSMIAIVWMVSVCISIPPLFGWRHDSDYPDKTGMCRISQDHGYTIFSTVGAFFCPLVLMLIVNFKIYRAARYQIRRKRFSRLSPTDQVMCTPIPTMTIDTMQGVLKATVYSGSDESQDCIGVCTNTNGVVKVDVEGRLDESESKRLTLNCDASPSQSLSNTLSVPTTCTMNISAPKTNANCNSNISASNHLVDKDRCRRERIHIRRERKAARVLGIITGAFVLCWLPFFILAVVNPMCGDTCHIPPYVFSLVMWLGYFNSLINPVIYTIFNPSFRCAFNKIFLRRFKSPNRLP